MLHRIFYHDSLKFGALVFVPLASPRFDTMLGYEPGEMDLSVSNWSAYVQESDLARSVTSIDRHIAGTTPCL